MRDTISTHNHMIGAITCNRIHRRQMLMPLPRFACALACTHVPHASLNLTSLWLCFSRNKAAVDAHLHVSACHQFAPTHNCCHISHHKPRSHSHVTNHQLTNAFNSQHASINPPQHRHQRHGETPHRQQEKNRQPADQLSHRGNLPTPRTHSPGL